MLYRLFNSNNPLTLVFLPLLGLILWLPSVISTENIFWHHSSPLFDLAKQNSGLTGVLVAFSVIVITGILVSRIINKSELFDKNQYLSALLYVMIMSCSAEGQIQNPILYSNLFIALALSNLFDIRRPIPCKNLIFKCSTLLLISALFYPPYLIFLPLPWIILFIIRPFSFKEWLMPFIGYGVVILYLLLFSSIDVIDFSFKNFTLNASFIPFVNNEFTPFLFSFCLLISLLALMSLVVVLKLYLKSKNRFKNLVLILFSFLFLAALILLKGVLITQGVFIFLILAMPISLFLPFFLIHNKKSWLSEGFVTISFLLLIIEHYFN